MCFFTCALFAVAMVNAGFEDVDGGKPVGWTIPPSMHVARGEGHNGSAGLVWRSDVKITERAVASQSIPITGEDEYVVSVQMRTEGALGGKGAKICASTYDAEGRKIAEVYPSGMRSASEWVCVKGLIVAGERARRLTLTLDVLPGCRGKVVFDEVVVEPVKRNPAIYAFSSAYRDTSCGDGDVTFNGFIYMPEGRKIGDIEAFFRYRGPDGRECRRKSDLTLERDEVYATLKVQSGDIAEGAQDVRFEVCGANGPVLGENVFRFSRVRELPSRKVYIDRHGRCVVNGKPFFPVGMYAHRMSDEDAAVYAGGPFNSVVVYGLSTREDLDRLAKHGIMYIPTLKNEIPGKIQASKRGIKTWAAAEAFFRAEIAKLKDAPNLLAWYVCDEAPLPEIPLRQRLYSIYRECDDDHPCWAVMHRLPRIREYLTICDVMGVDPYPVDGRPMSRVSNFASGVRVVTRGDRAVWSVPQNFDWKWYNRPSTRGVPNRMPTAEEMSFINWCHIAHGANGLMGYSFSAIYQEDGRRGSRADFPKYWKDICKSYADVKRLSDVLLSVEAVPRAPVTPPETPVRMWRKDGRLFVLSCNSGKKPEKVSVPVGDAGLRIEAVEFGNAESVTVSDGTVVFDLPPSGYSMVRCGN